MPAYVRPPLGGARFRWGGAIRRNPPLGALPSMLRLRGRRAPVELDFRSWVQRHADERTADMLSSIAGVYTFHHDPGELSAAFVWEHSVRLFLKAPPPATVVRYVQGGWSNLTASLERRVRALGVEVETGHRATELPSGTVILAVELEQARGLLGDDRLAGLSGRTVCLDIGVKRRRSDPWIVSDMDEAGWIGRYSASDRRIAPAGHELIQAQMPIRPQETAEQAGARLERFLDLSLEEWRARETWRRRQVMDARSGALDLPGVTWRDRPAIDGAMGCSWLATWSPRPGLLAEVSFASAVEAGRLALEAADAGRPRLRNVA